MTVTGPATAVLGAVESIDVVWGTTPNELDPDMMYLGGVSFTDTANEVGFTFVKIDS
jgi:hypothetical protein